MNKEIKYKKVVEYQYPNGNKCNYNFISFYLMNILFFFIGWVLFPLWYCLDIFDNFKGRRKVYFRRTK